MDNEARGRHNVARGRHNFPVPEGRGGILTLLHGRAAIHVCPRDYDFDTDQGRKVQHEVGLMGLGKNQPFSAA